MKDLVVKVSGLVTNKVSLGISNLILAVAIGLFVVACGGGGGSSSDGGNSGTPGNTNATPIANAQSLSLDQYTTLAITLSGSDADGDTLTYSIATTPSNGVLSGTAPNVVYTPNDVFFGADSFTFTTNDGSATSSPAAVNINVIEVISDLDGGFDFHDIPEALANQYADSETLNFAGFPGQVALSVAGGEYSINNADFTSADGFLTAGDDLVLRLMSSDSAGQTVSMTVNIGTFSDSFSVTTSSDTQPPTVSFVFPSSTSYTTLDNVFLRGSTTDDGTVGAVTVNGVNATSSDNFATWVVSMPVVKGSNTYTAVATDLGNNSSQNDPTASVVGMLNIEPDQIEYNSITKKATIFSYLNNTLFSFDGQNNIYQMISDANTPAGNPTIGPAPDFSYDEVNEKAFFIGGGLRDFIYETDTQTGVNTVLLEDENVYPSQFLVTPNKTSLDVENNLIYVMDATPTGAGRNEILVFDINTNTFSTLSSGRSAVWPGSMDLDSNHARILISDNFNRSIWAIDTTTGSAQQLALTGNISLQVEYGLRVDKANNRALMFDQNQGVLAFDLDSLELTQIAPNATANGLNIFSDADMKYDSANNQLFLLIAGQNALYKIDLDTGESSIFSDNTLPNALVPFSSPIGLEVDSANNRLLVTNSNGNDATASVMAVSLDDGSRTILSNETLPDASNSLLAPAGIVLAANNQAYLVDRGVGGMFNIDLTSGARQQLTSNTEQDSNSTFVQLTSIVEDADNNRLLVTDPRQKALFAVDKTSGERSIISSASQPNDNNPLVQSEDIILQGGRGLVLQLDNILSVNLATGERTVFSGVGVPDSQNLLVSPKSFVVDAANNRLLVVDLQGVKTVDLSDGTRGILSDISIPDGVNPFDFLQDITLDPNNNRALVVDSNLEKVLAVDLTSGQRTIYQGGTHPQDPPLVDPTDIIFDQPNNRYIVYGNNYLTAYRGFFAVDAQTGARQELLGFNQPNTGTVYPRINDMLLDSANSRLLVVNYNSLYALSLETGEINILAGGDFPSVDNNLSSIAALAYDASNDRVFVVDRSFRGIFEIALSTGEQTLRYQGLEGEFDTVQGFVLDSVNNRLMVLDNQRIHSLDLSNDNFQIFSDSSVAGIQNPINSPVDMQIDPVNNRLLVLDTNQGVIAVDLTTAQHTRLKDDNANGAIYLSRAKDISLTGSSEELIAVDENIGVVRIDLVTGERLILSQ